MHASLNGMEFKQQLRSGAPKVGLFLNSHSPTVAEQLAHSGYDWLLVDTQHGPMGNETLSAMLCGIANGGAKSMVRVSGYGSRRHPAVARHGRRRRPSALHQYRRRGARGGELLPLPTAGTRSVYFPQRSMNKGGLLGYAGAATTT